MCNTMFKRKYKKIVNYRKNDGVYRIEIEGFDEECPLEVWIIKNFIKDLSVNRRVFLELHGDTLATDKEAVLHMESDSRYWFVKKLEILPEKIEYINIPELLENVWTHFYFFHNCVNWKEFLEMKKVGFHFKQGDLAAALYLFNLDSIWIEIGESSGYHVEELFEQLEKEKYTIKRRL